ncbi:MAG TPA: DUF2064 domain-containing protein [Thermoanaerobaculia bacterium]|jgi:2-phospho-L-lactate guanylyltransferase (CobY/MobA/RfbA family)
MERAAERCVLLFAVSAAAEARAKRLGRAGVLLAYARRRLAAAVAELPGVDLLLVGEGAPSGARELPQRGSSFGERLENAFADARARGYRDIVAVPGDVPQLGADILRRAFALLADHSTVLGPSPDGGVYLLGCRAEPRALRTLLVGVAWRRASVFAELLARSTGAAVLPPLADLDAPRDLAAVFSALSGADLPADLIRLLARLLSRAGIGRRERGRAPRRLLLADRRATRGPPAAAAAR